jgi:hypothetical protein
MGQGKWDRKRDKEDKDTDNIETLTAGILADALLPVAAIALLLYCPVLRYCYTAIAMDFVHCTLPLLAWHTPCLLLLHCRLTLALPSTCPADAICCRDRSSWRDRDRDRERERDRYSDRSDRGDRDRERDR